MADEIVEDWRGVKVRLAPRSYFHWSKSNDFLLHNAKLGKGVVATISAVAKIPGLEGFTTPYALLNGSPQKENEWERVRAECYPSRPSRMKALFCFENREFALRAKQEWFHEEDCRLVEIRIEKSANSWRADSKWLEGDASTWSSNAEHYWRGDMTDNPFPEIIIDGLLYFPEWETFELFTPN